MSSSFAYEDPLLRQNLSTQQKAREIMKEMGRGMWRSGKGFGKVGALFAGIECVFESVSLACILWRTCVRCAEGWCRVSIARGTTWSIQ